MRVTAVRKLQDRGLLRKLCVRIERELFRLSRNNYVKYSYGFRTIWSNLYRNHLLRRKVTTYRMRINRLVDAAINDPHSLATERVLKKRKEFNERCNSSRVIHSECPTMVNPALDDTHWLRPK
jgi:hypothetical protein